MRRLSLSRSAMCIDTWLGCFRFELGVFASSMCGVCPGENMSSFFGQKSSVLVLGTRNESCRQFVLWLARFVTEPINTMVRTIPHPGDDVRRV